MNKIQTLPSRIHSLEGKDPENFLKKATQKKRNQTQKTNNSILNVTPLKKKTNDKIGIQRVNYIVKRCVQRNSKCIFLSPKHIPFKKNGISLG